MNLKYIFLLLCILCFMLNSCSDVLDIAPDGRISLADVFADNDKTAAFLNSCYNNIPEKGIFYDGNINQPTALCDEGWLSFNLQDHTVPKMYSNNASATTHPIRDFNQTDPNNNLWAIYMSQIRICTQFINNIDKANVSNPADRLRWRAEAHVLRAYFYSELVKWFGGLPIEPNEYSIDYDYTKLTRKSVWEVAQYIEQDCDIAIQTDELPWHITEPSEIVRVTKALAWAIKSKMYLFAASPLHNITNDMTHWDKAYEVNKAAVEALEGHGYALKTQIQDNANYTGTAAAYHELFSNNLSLSDDKETIWQGTSSMSFWRLSYIGSTTWKSTGLAGVCPTQEMVDAFEVTNADRTKAEPLLDLSTPYNTDHTPNYNQKAIDLGYNKNDPYNCYRDPRMNVTILVNGDKVVWNGEEKTVETFKGGANGIDDAQVKDNLTRTGYYFKKYVKPGTSETSPIQSPPWKYFRLAEIKLNYAEAAAESGHLDDAHAQVDIIRTRVGMPPLLNSLSQTDLILRIHNERRVELVYEECRYFDLRRWQKPDGNLVNTCKTLTAIWIAKNSDGTFTYERKSTLINKSTNTRDLLLPLPFSEALNLKTLTKKNWQNPEW